MNPLQLFIYHDAKIMIISFVQLLVLAVFSGFAYAEHSYGQDILDNKITLELKDISLSDALKIIEFEAKVRFAYSREFIDTKQNISVSAQGEKLSEALESLLTPLDIDYEIIGGQIVLKRKRPNKSIEKISRNLLENEKILSPDAPLKKLTIQRHLSYLNIQDKTITGKVTHENEPLPGVNILVKGTSVGTITDANGNYKLEVPSDANTLVFSSVGYITEEVTIGDRTIVNLELSPDITKLSEIVVIGYGSVKKSDLTGSVASIKAEELKAVPIVSLDHGLQGRAAGVQVTQASGAPGSAVSVRIRGGNSVFSGNEPLYVIDGLPIYPSDNSYGAGVSVRGSLTNSALSTINPNDIESIEILKDASATAIYGSRGANGVVIITTKKGQPGEPKVDYEGYYGWQTLANKIDMMNARQYAEFANDVSESQGVPPQIPDPSVLGEGTDWQDEVYRTAVIQSHQLSVSGGTDKFTYALSTNYLDQEGILQGSRFRRGSIRSNIDAKIHERVRIGSNVTLAHLVNDLGQSEADGGTNGGAVANALNMPPTIPVFNDDGTFTDAGLNNVWNPIAIIEGTQDRKKTSRILGNVFVDVNIIEGLTFKTLFGGDIFRKSGNLFSSSITNTGRNGGSAFKSQSDVFFWTWENTLSYDKQITEKHRINVVVGATRQQEIAEGFGAGATGFVNDILEDNSLSSGSTFGPPFSYKRKWTIASYLARVNYIFDEKYLLTLSGRRDGSSRFGENNKWGNFGSVAVAWRAGEEGFIRELNLFDDLKIRVSYGRTGNQEIPLFGSQPRLQTQNYVLGGALANGFGPQGLANPDLKWETTTMTNIGLDLAFVGGRLTATADYYFNETDDLLLQVPIPVTAGGGNALRNIGSMENKGLEFALGYDLLPAEMDFQWNISGNISFNENEVTDIGDIPPFLIGMNVSEHLKSNGSWLIPGEPLGVWFGMQYDGVFQNQEQLDNGITRTAEDDLGWARYVDQDGDGDIDADDRVIIGDPNPDFIFGLNSNMSFKNFDLTIFITGSQGNDIKNHSNTEIVSANTFRNQAEVVVDRWSSENPNTNIPQAGNNGLDGNSSFYIEDGSYVRFRSVTLGYNFPVDVIPFFRNARVYISGQNLITLTDYTGYDPEVNNPGSQVSNASNVNLGNDWSSFPRPKSFQIGVNIGI